MPKENMQLQTALRELEMITDHLSKKDVDVEAGLKKFKEGVDLIKFCRSQLQKAENEFKKLKAELEEEDSKDAREPEENFRDLPF